VTAHSERPGAPISTEERTARVEALQYLGLVLSDGAQHTGAELFDRKVIGTRKPGSQWQYDLVVKLAADDLLIREGPIGPARRYRLSLAPASKLWVDIVKDRIAAERYLFGGVELLPLSPTIHEPEPQTESEEEEDPLARILGKLLSAFEGFSGRLGVIEERISVLDTFSTNASDLATNSHKVTWKNLGLLQERLLEQGVEQEKTTKSSQESVERLASSLSGITTSFSGITASFSGITANLSGITKLASDLSLSLNVLAKLGPRLDKFDERADAHEKGLTKLNAKVQDLVTKAVIEKKLVKEYMADNENLKKSTDKLGVTTLSFLKLVDRMFTEAEILPSTDAVPYQPPSRSQGRAIRSMLMSYANESKPEKKP
jgi:hypothetical protein